MHGGVAGAGDRREGVVEESPQRPGYLYGLTEVVTEQMGLPRVQLTGPGAWTALFFMRPLPAVQSCPA